MLLSLSLRGEAEEAEATLQAHATGNRAQVSWLHCKAQQSVAWQDSARSLFRGPGLYLQVLEVWQRVFSSC